MSRKELIEHLSRILSDTDEGADLEDMFGSIQELYWELQEERQPKEE